MSVSGFARKSIAALFLVSLSACGTTYVIPETGDGVSQQAAQMFSAAQAEPPRKAASLTTAEARFHRVVRRVKPVAEAFCRKEFAEGREVDCNVPVEIDRKMAVRNAYFTYRQPGNKSPVIRFTMPLLQDVRSDDEVAFVLGHEYGHLIGQHRQKKQQQEIAGALILGAISAYANASAASYGGYYDSNAVSRDVELGAQLGNIAFSQTYELESDMLGTRIAHAAGYDPVKGAQFFARSEDVKVDGGKLSFWGTHPADSKRVSVVIATMDEIKRKQGLVKKQK